MAQVIAPEVWQEGIEDNRFLPGRYTTGMFTGSGVKIANNNEACRVWDIMVSDYITTYDDRRLNGLKGTNADGRDGWGASAYGVFQDVRFDSRVYTMGRHRSIAMRIFDEMQYAGGIGEFGDATTSNVITNGQSLMKTAAILSKAKDLWQQEVLGPDIDKYNLFAVCNGHISGRAVGWNWDAKDNEQKPLPHGLPAPEKDDQIFTGRARDYAWIAQPGSVEGQAIPPRFAPIHCIEWDSNNIPLLLQTIKVTWNNLFMEQGGNNRVIYIDPNYEYDLLMSLTGNGIPATDSAYTDIQNGSFTKLMGWTFNFEIPSQYWPTLFVDAGLNVVHSKNAVEAYDAILPNPGVGGNENSKNYTYDYGKTLRYSDNALLRDLMNANREQQMNYVRTEWDGSKFVKKVTNYPFGAPSAAPFWSNKETDTQFGGYPVNSFDAYSKNEIAAGSGSNPHMVSSASRGATADKDTVTKTVTAGYGEDAIYPWTGAGFGYGTGQSFTHGTTKEVQVIGLALYRPAAQLSQEYSEMVTDEGKTRGKFQEMCMDVKYDAWVIEGKSFGIMPIIDANGANEPALGAAGINAPTGLLTRGIPTKEVTQ